MKAYVRLRAVWAALALLSVQFLTGCGGGGGDAATTTPGNASGAASQQPCSVAADCGEVYVALTDADGDFLSYTIDVQALTLKRADGTSVAALPVATRVDFAQYVDLTEFLTAATVPNGSYVEGTLRLDYSNAEVTIERNGQAVAASVVDADGHPLGVVDVRVVLDNRHRLVVAPGRPALLTLDFDLGASHTVDLNTVPVTATARPVLVASLDPVDEKELRLRGALVSVDAAASTYLIDVRPFHHRTARLGRVTVHTDAATSFEINGQSHTGAEGLQALAAVGAGAATVAFGTLDVSQHRFDAAIVHAGSSDPGAGIDAVLGNVLARSGAELLVRGGTLVRSDDGSARFVRGEITVLLGPDTKVFKDAVRPVEVLGPDAVSVGQSIQAFGTVRQDNEHFILDATQGRVRMHLTHLFGTVEQAIPGAVTLDLDAIDARRVSAFDFAGTGANPSDDADPEHYEVATGSLNVIGLLPGEPVRVFGFVSPFGAAPPDFAGRTIVDYRELRATLSIGFGAQGTTAPFLSSGAAGLLLNLSNPAIGNRHELRVGLRVIDLLDLPASPTIQSAAGGRTAYVIAKEHDSRVFDDFAEFVTELNLQLNGSTALLGLTAHGSYTSDSNVMSVNSVIAILK